MMTERRGSIRWELNDFPKYNGDERFRVIDIRTGQSIGQLVDISDDGMRIICKNPITTETKYKLRIDLPEEVAGCDQLNVDAENVWCRRDEKNDLFQAGFKFQSTFPHHADIIELLFFEPSLLE